MQNYRELLVWKKGIKLVKEVYNLSRKLPREEQYGIVSQINRAAISIPSNIAEGTGRSGKNDFIRFLEIALGSLYEVETQLILINELQFLPKENINSLMDLIVEEQKMLNSLIKKIRT